MPNAYYHYKCPECGEELNKLRVTDELERSEDEREWVANYDCPNGCGHKEVYVTESDDYDFERDSIRSVIHAEGSAWVSNKKEGDDGKPIR